MNYRNLAIFVALSCGLGWFLMSVLPNLVEISEVWQQILLVVVYLWSPGIVGYILHKRNGGSLGDLGFLSGRLDVKWLGKSALAPLLVLGGTLGVVFLMGNILGIPGFGRVGLGDPGSVSLLTDGLYHNPALAEALGAIAPFSFFPTSNIGGLVILAVMFIFMGSVLGQVFFLGQELAWRGFLFHETRKMGFLGASLVSGAVWALWTLFPLLARGYFEPTDLIHTTGLLIAMSFLITYVSVKTGNIMGAAAFRGVFTFIGVLAAILITQAEPLLGSMNGVAGIATMLGITFLILRSDKKFVENYDSLSYPPASQEEEE